ncbi:hypothetical protein Pint_10340 [Pistacia integerrima]|uniref:Uncharacterized protein n=1 Tax=Pistacia integerrima TaxID=434235 RepID=A0ACC0XIP1_9ROSI|nr:hypothetical protein Pint_10340 [Pistacia integerrima]
MEKFEENRTTIQYLPYVTRWDYLATMFMKAITVNGQKYWEIFKYLKGSVILHFLFIT